MGWAIDPQAFGDTLLALHARYRLPIYVMENGFGARGESDANGQVKDQDRIDYLQSYTDALRVAIKQGADVRGYFVWSLMDNFEWNSGYAARFGLVYVDYTTLRLTPKASFAWYANLIKAAAAR
jgi:beta-glucosidase